MSCLAQGAAAGSVWRELIAGGEAPEANGRADTRAATRCCRDGFASRTSPQPVSLARQSVPHSRAAQRPVTSDAIRGRRAWRAGVGCGASSAAQGSGLSTRFRWGGPAQGNTHPPDLTEIMERSPQRSTDSQPASQPRHAGGKTTTQAHHSLLRVTEPSAGGWRDGWMGRRGAHAPHGLTPRGGVIGAWLANLEDVSRTHRSSRRRLASRAHGAVTSAGQKAIGHGPAGTRALAQHTALHGEQKKRQAAESSRGAAEFGA